MLNMNRTQDAFAFLRLFEDAVSEISPYTEDGEALEQLRRRVVDKVLKEIAAPKMPRTCTKASVEESE